MVFKRLFCFSEENEQRLEETYFFVRFCLRLLLAILRFALPAWDFLLLPARCRPDISDNFGIPSVAARLMGVPIPAANSALYVAVHLSSPSWELTSKPRSRPIITNDLAIPKFTG